MKHNYCFPIYNRLLYLWASGLINYWTDKYTPNVDKCLIKSNKPKINSENDGLKALMLKDFTGAFLLLGLGLSMAFLVFLLELIVFYYKKVQEQKRRQ